MAGVSFRATPKQQRLAVVKTVAENANGLLARLNALHQLACDRDNLALGWAILVIFFVFLAVETAPVLTKILFRYGPYDMRFCRKFCSGGHEGAVTPVCGRD